jgi:hypothetical protein
MSAGVLAAAWLCRRAARDGWHLVHGSCLVVDGGGVLCLGGKASGKSTLAMLAAQVLGASVVANDRVLVRAAAGVVEAMAVPRSGGPGLRPGRSAGLTEALAAAARDGQLVHPSVRGPRLLAAANGRTERLDDEGGVEVKLPLLAGELAQLVGLRWRPHAEVTRVIRLTLTRGSEEVVTSSRPASLVRRDYLTREVIAGPADKWLGVGGGESSDSTPLAALPCHLVRMERSVELGHQGAGESALRRGSQHGMRTAVRRRHATTSRRSHSDGSASGQSSLGDERDVARARVAGRPATGGP